MFWRVDDDIRQSEGFKNVSLGNVLAVAYATKKEKLTFLREEDKVTQAGCPDASFYSFICLLGCGQGNFLPVPPEKKVQLAYMLVYFSFKKNSLC